LVDSLLEATTLIGSAGYVRDRPAAYWAVGVTIVQIEALGPNPPAQTIGKLRERITKVWPDIRRSNLAPVNGERLCASSK
jgi:hypothetical protein